MKEMISEIVATVKNDRSNRSITIEVKKENINPEKPKPRKKKNKSAEEQNKENKITEGSECTLCKKGKIIKGKTAYGCSEWKNGCTFRLPL